MSALHLILPRLQAAAVSTAVEYVSSPVFPGARRGTLAQAAGRLQQHSRNRENQAQENRRLHVVSAPRTPEIQPGMRKGPHRLRLLHAQATTTQSGPALLPTGPKRLPESVGGVSFEFYRTYSEAMLRRYSRLSLESGRVPSLLGRELFRGHVTSCKVHSFGDVSNFVHDMERAMQELTPGQRYLVRRIAVQQYTQGETAALTGLSLRTVVRRYADALDKLTRVLLDRKLLEPLT